MGKYLFIILLFISVFISAFSQILLKKSANIKHESFIKEYLNFRVIFAYFLFFTAVIIDLIALRYAPLSFVPVIETSSYIFILVLSRIFLKEKMSKYQILGMLVIITGIFIYIK